jgi:hypothetical protein
LKGIKCASDVREAGHDQFTHTYIYIHTYMYVYVHIIYKHEYYEKGRPGTRSLTSCTATGPVELTFISKVGVGNEKDLKRAYILGAYYLYYRDNSNSNMYIHIYQIYIIHLCTLIER